MLSIAEQINTEFDAFLTQLHVHHFNMWRNTLTHLLGLVTVSKLRLDDHCLGEGLSKY